MGMAKSRLNRLRLCSVLLGALVVIAGCAPRTADPRGRESSGADEPQAVAFEWSSESDCGVCHSTLVASMQGAACQALSLEQGGAACAACHDDGAGIAGAHEGAVAGSEEPARLAKTGVADQACLRCHGDRETQAAATEGSTALTDSEGTPVNPHALPESGGHTDITCADCHKMHDASALGELAKKQCLTCHHEDVFECNTCHEEQ